VIIFLSSFLFGCFQKKSPLCRTTSGEIDKNQTVSSQDSHAFLVRNEHNNGNIRPNAWPQGH
jgi:hypothetical protein